jgi:hypothetical protein
MMTMEPNDLVECAICRQPETKEAAIHVDPHKRSVWMCPYCLTAVFDALDDAGMPFFSFGEEDRVRKLAADHEDPDIDLEDWLEARRETSMHAPTILKQALAELEEIRRNPIDRSRLKD